MAETGETYIGGTRVGLSTKALMPTTLNLHSIQKNYNYTPDKRYATYEDIEWLYKYGRMRSTYLEYHVANKNIINNKLFNCGCNILSRYYERFGDVDAQKSLIEMPGPGEANKINYYQQIYSIASHSMGENGINTIPQSWENAKHLRYIYFYRQGLTASDFDILIPSIEQRFIDGMSDDGWTGTRLLYFHVSGGTNPNTAPNWATHIANGYTRSGNRLIKTITNIEGRQVTFKMLFNP